MQSALPAERQVGGSTFWSGGSLLHVSSSICSRCTVASRSATWQAVRYFSVIARSVTLWAFNALHSMLFGYGTCTSSRSSELHLIAQCCTPVLQLQYQTH